MEWFSQAEFLKDDQNPHKFELKPVGNQLQFVFEFSPKGIDQNLIDTNDCFEASKKGWADFWKSGAAIDLSGSSDSRWMELERRIVLSQYLMKVNEAGSLPPQESELVNNR